ncbi:MAG: carbamoyltransferase HypF [Dehalococcoidia bacterium]|nr:carbamoyltransferase HypF [Dehalococcoidia bacterium]
MPNPEPTKSLRVTVRGVVQGVGFRPFIYRLAHEHCLAGWVRNTSGSVEIHVEGDGSSMDTFVQEIEKSPPPMAKIEEIRSSSARPVGYTGFKIVESRPEPGEYQLVSPDIATCEACRQEIFSPDNRRHRYPFTNCTNCGPRFTIIEDIPYDRPLTTMKRFTMCPACQREYDDPLDRRFHAQPNACPVCGPSLSLADAHGAPVESRDVIHSAANLLMEGKILAIKGLGGFLLACDATDSEAVKTLRERKHRPSKPLAVMMSSLGEIARHCMVSPEEEQLLRSPQSPIVLLRWRREESSVCAEVAPNLKYLGVMLPYTPLHHLLMSEVGCPLVMTSGNLSEEPIAKANDEALRRLGGVADYFLLHNRDIYAKYDDSVCIVETEIPRVVRRARGYAPYPITLPYESRRILACGAEEKNTFCLTRDRHAFVSQHIGDMENEETLEHFETTIELYKKLFRTEPEIIAYDLHPEYLSTKYALELKAKNIGLRFVPVQHHHAHIASCLVENGMQTPVIGVAFDGTGYGGDGTIWGGEFLVADLKGFRRVGHLEHVPMPGGAAAIRKPYRMALGYTHSLLGPDFPLHGLPILGPLDTGEHVIVARQMDRRVNSPLTSSAGRLFDAVSALAGVRAEIDYEAQAAIELEMLADEDEKSSAAYPFSIVEEDDCRVVKLGALIAAMIDDVKNGVSPGAVSTRFHLTVAAMIVEMCRAISRDTGIKLVALSGGGFQNRLLLRLALDGLREEGFEVLTHRLVPCNDGGISLGQAAIANFAPA